MIALIMLVLKSKPKPSFVLLFGVLIFSQNIFAAAAKTNIFTELLDAAVQSHPGSTEEFEKLVAAEKFLASKSLFWTPQTQLRFEKGVRGSEAEVSRLGVDLNLMRFGSDVAGYRAARFSKNAQVARRELKQLDLERDVAELIFRYILARSEEGFYKRSLGLKEKALTIAQEKYRRGQTPQQDVLRARLERDQSELSLAERKDNLLELRDQLMILAGRNDFQDLAWPFLDQVNESTGDKAKEGSVEKSLDLKVMEEEAKSARQKYLSSKLGFFPKLDFSTSWAATGLGLSEKGDWQAQLTLTIPLWDQMANYAQSRQYLAEARILEVKLERLERTTKVKNDSLSERLEVSRAAAKRALESLQSMQSLLDDSLKRFEIGRASLNDLFLDENRFLQAETSAQSALANFHRRLVEACHSHNESLLSCR